MWKCELGSAKLGLMKIIIFITVLALPAAALAEAPRFSLPIACALGQDCAIQNYVDTDPGPQWKDYRCGAMSYDGHDGTDFRIADLEMMRAGVPVLAAADGMVLRVRDGMADGVYRQGSNTIPDNAACGNGVIIDHGGGWTTQYCHLRKNSLAVRPDEPVKRGSLLGLVGQSGRAQVPHVHFEVAVNGKSVDPFTADGNREATIPACGTTHAGLWRDDVARALPYRAPLVLNTGFAAGSIAMEDIETRARTIARLLPDTPALVFYGRAIGTSEGDTQRITITAPDGSVFARNTTDPEPRPRAQAMAFTGRKRPASGWQDGVYTARYRIIRDRAVIAERTESITLGE